MSDGNAGVAGSVQRPPFRVLGRANSSATESCSSYTHSSSSACQKAHSYSSTATTQDMGPPKSAPGVVRQGEPQSQSQSQQTNADTSSHLPPPPTLHNDSPPAPLDDAHGSWKFEFRGMVRLVRWMSTKGSKSASGPTDAIEHSTEATDSAQTSTQRQAKLVRRATTRTLSSPQQHPLSSTAATGSPKPETAPPLPVTKPASLSRRVTLRSLFSDQSLSSPSNPSQNASPRNDVPCNALNGHSDEAPFHKHTDLRDVVEQHSGGSQSQGGQTIRATRYCVVRPGADLPIGSNADRLPSDRDPNGPSSQSTSSTRSKGRKHRKQLDLSLARPDQDSPLNATSNPGPIATLQSLVTAPVISLDDPVPASIPTAVATLRPGSSTDPSAFSHTPQEAARESMTYMVNPFPHAANQTLQITDRDVDHPPLASPSTTAASEYGHSHTPSLDATLVSHLQTHSDIGHGPVSTSLYPPRQAEVYRSISLRHPLANKPRAPAAQMGRVRNDSIQRSNSSGSRRRSSIRRKKSTGAKLKDKLKRSFSTKATFALSAPSFFTRSKADLLLAAEREGIPPRRSTSPLTSKKVTLAIPERVTVSSDAGDGPPVVDLKLSPIALAVDHHRRPSTDRFGRVSSECASGPGLSPSSPFRSLSPLPPPLSYPGAEPSELGHGTEASHMSFGTTAHTMPSRSPVKRKLTKKRGGSLGSATDVSREASASRSFLNGLAGAFGGLSMTSLNVTDSQTKSSRSKLQKKSPPPPAWLRSSSTVATSIAPSPLFSSPPSPETPFTPPLSQEKRSTSGLFAKISSRTSDNGHGSVAISGGTKLQKKKSRSATVSGGKALPPLPPIPKAASDPAQIRPNTTGNLSRRSSALPLDLTGTDAHRHPMTSLVYTGKQAFYADQAGQSEAPSRQNSQETTSLLKPRPTSAGEGNRDTFYTALTSFPLRDSVASTQSEEIPSPGLLDGIPPSYFYTSPSSPVGFAGHRRASMYDSPQPVETPLPSSHSTLRPPRPNFPHRPSSNSAKRWTIAVNSIADDGEFLREIDDLHKTKSKRAGTVEGDSTPNVGEHDGDSLFEIESDEEAVWMKARKAMLCVRELIRTEASYRRHLTAAYDVECANASSTAPPEVLSYFPLLIGASSALSTRLEEDPSAWGVSSAFLGVEDELEKALVSWCSISGRVMSDLAANPSAANVRVSHYRKYTKDKDAPKRSDTAGSSSASSSNHAKVSKSLRDKSRRSSTGSSFAPSPRSVSQPLGKPLSLQDVAIMPSQRVPRYQLLFKDLLKETPATSPSRALVERALEAAIRIAKTCDEAQQHNHLLVGTA